MDPSGVLLEGLEEIESLKAQIDRELAECRDLNQLESLRIKYLGRKGILRGLFRDLSQIEIEKRKLWGQRLNELRDYLEKELEGKKKALSAAREKEAYLDITLPGFRIPLGRKHPLTQVLDEIKDIFREMGFTVEEGPEVETDYYNFEALNFPPDHPSRDMHDTLYVDNGKLLRTHTSPVQIRVMETRQPPIRIIAPGRCFRKDTPDATHSPFFHQVEGLYVDKNVTFADLKGVMAAFARKLFGEAVRIQFRPSYFPFTEPSAECDISCVICGGQGCRTCKGTGWLEIAGAGMVDPDVFRRVGYDPEKYTGYAFGMGVERLAMLKYRINDIRLFFENDLRFLDQF